MQTRFASLGPAIGTLLAPRKRPHATDFDGFQRFDLAAQVSAAQVSAAQVSAARVSAARVSAARVSAARVSAAQVSAELPDRAGSNRSIQGLKGLASRRQNRNSTSVTSQFVSGIVAGEKKRGQGVGLVQTGEQAYMTQAATEQLNVLEQRHRDLDRRVQYLERRAILTPGEQRQVQDLKKQKLLAKDELHAMRQSVRP
jgi:uncharacterized protein YdcH (DUF465 family)